MDDDTDPLRDKIHDGLASAVREDETAMVAKWVLVMEVITADGVPALWSMASPGMSMWDQIGMLQFRRDMLVPDPPTGSDDG